MKLARSMYLGGELISASESDFNTCKKMGLCCPICHQAVFLRTGGERLRNGKIQLISPYFAHYKAGESDLDCENRILSAKGKKRLDEFLRHAHNQRLILYNNHLWEMYASDRNITKQHRRFNTDWFGEREVAILARNARKLWARDIAKIRILIKKALDEYYLSGTIPKSLLEDFPDNDFSRQKDYFANKCNIRLHLKICGEIADFLTTPTSGYFWEKLTQSAIGVLCLMGKIKEAEIARQVITPERYINAVVGFIATTHWIDQINRRLGIFGNVYQ